MNSDKNKCIEQNKNKKRTKRTKQEQFTVNDGESIPVAWVGVAPYSLIQYRLDCCKSWCCDNLLRQFHSGILPWTKAEFVMSVDVNMCLYFKVELWMYWKDDVLLIR